MCECGFSAINLLRRFKKFNGGLVKVLSYIKWQELGNPIQTKLSFEVFKVKQGVNHSLFVISYFN